MLRTQRGAVCDQDVRVVRDLVPLVQQGLTSGQVEAPAVVPRLPAHTHTHAVRKGSFNISNTAFLKIGLIESDNHQQDKQRYLIPCTVD